VSVYSFGFENNRFGGENQIEFVSVWPSQNTLCPKKKKVQIKIDLFFSSFRLKLDYLKAKGWSQQRSLARMPFLISWNKMEQTLLFKSVKLQNQSHLMKTYSSNQ